MTQGSGKTQGITMVLFIIATAVGVIGWGSPAPGTYHANYASNQLTANCVVGAIAQTVSSGFGISHTANTGKVQISAHITFTSDLGGQDNFQIVRSKNAIPSCGSLLAGQSYSRGKGGLVTTSGTFSLDIVSYDNTTIGSNLGNNKLVKGTTYNWYLAILETGGVDTITMLGQAQTLASGNELTNIQIVDIP